ncbi:1-acyl-sn-glycerol-3-phosphate acyltransferase gamma-like [Drosophila navojoa]|nr:1-acyl-sn-glycerol-3-phosphate acyltransferase gamma-like [Drosophila navojoa]
MVSVKALKRSMIPRLVIAITFFSCGFGCNIVQCLLMILIKPFSPSLYRRLIYYPLYAFYSQMVVLAEWYGGGRLHVYMDSEDLKHAGKEHGVVLMNHYYEIDWLVLWMFLDKLKMLGTSKAFSKKPIRYLPVLGWAWWMAEFVFLNRDFEKDKAIIAKQLKIIFSYPEPVWLLLTAEGTRFTPAKHEVAMKFAKEKGLKPLKYHLIPRTRGFTTSLPTLRNICPAIYDMNVAFKSDSDVPVNLNSVLSGETLNPYILVRRFPTETIPTDEKEAAAWLHNLYVEKDRIIESFHESGSFFKTSGIKEMPCIVFEPRPISLFVFAIIGISSMGSLFYYLIVSLLSANWYGVIFVVALVVLFSVLLKKADNVTQVSKGSNYGVSESKAKTN